MSFPPIPRWKILAGVAAVALLTAAVSLVLWWPATRGLDGKDLVSARLDALKVGLSIGVGGGLFALYLAWRRQRSTEADLDNRERALEHQLRVAAATEADSLERRITDLYAKAADMLGAEKAHVRLAGLYALERLAQGNPEQRQTIVDVLCAYLRMPFTPPVESPENATPEQLTEHRQRVQEHEVRTAAQRLLETHLRERPETFWADIRLNLSGATLVNVDFDDCRVLAADFVDSLFVGRATFRRTLFTEEVRFTRATFDGLPSFEGTEFAGRTSFKRAEFTQAARFGQARFSAEARFDNARFNGWVEFIKNRFVAGASFRSVTFGNTALFTDGVFNGVAVFDDSKFTDAVRFRDTRFITTPTFFDTQFVQDTPPEAADYIARQGPRPWLPPAYDDD